ncbi:RICIN domain-containing protein [Amycolatopsis circi]|uniref:RICIN domain-containing protein n=1 Tax=Amycolatopsis circi TaxID=871959 RepID=UPI000E22FB57|nr:RICIN domain-containing protein [Amycolatopsis circi]
MTRSDPLSAPRPRPRHRRLARAAAIAIAVGIVAAAAPVTAAADTHRHDASAERPAAAANPPGSKPGNGDQDTRLAVGGDLTPAPAKAPAPAGQSSESEKGTAAALLGIVAGPELLILSDRDFVAAMYRAADDLDKPHPLAPLHQTVRARAIDALTAGDDAPTAYIKTGMAAANAVDQKINTDRSEAQRKEREAKARAAKVISVAVTDTDLDKTVYDFIVLLDLKADDRNDIAVKASALAALKGSAEDQWRFLTDGIIAEHAKDTQRLIDEDTTRNEAQKAEAKARQARVTAASYALKLSITVDDDLAKLPDQNFLREVLKRAPKDSDVYIAAYEAFLSTNPADWKAYVDTGAQAAAQRDSDKEMKKADDANITAITEIRTRADKSWVHPDLVAAADAALAGAPLDRAKFLATGQLDHQSQTIQTYFSPDNDSYLADLGGAAVAKWSPGRHPEFTWKIEPGLSDPSCYSFESTTHPNSYLHWLPPANGTRANADVSPTDGTPKFRQESTWCVHSNGSWASISPVNAPGAFLYLPGAEVDNHLDSVEWRIAAPEAPTPFDRTYNDYYSEDIRARLGKPTGDPVLSSDNTGYRPYEGGRLYLTHEGSALRVGDVYYGPALDKLLTFFGPSLLQQYIKGQSRWTDNDGTKGERIKVLRPDDPLDLYVVWSPKSGAHETHGVIGHTWLYNWETFGYPTTDETAAPGGAVYNHFTRGSIYYTPAAGIRTVTGEIHKKYAALNYESGPLGNPVTEAAPFGSDGGVVQRFDGGSIYYTPAGGAMAVYGAIGAKYAEFGKETGILGYPVADTAKTADSKGEFITLSNGASIYWSPATGAHAVYGDIRLKWLSLGAEKSFLGFPTSDELPLTKGRRNTFAGGRIDYSSESSLTIAYSLVTVTAKAIEFKGVQSGRCIQIAGVGDGAKADFAGAELWDCFPTAPKQIWDVVDLGGSKYALKNRNSGKCLDLYAAGADNGANIAQYTCHYGAAQQWEITTAPGSAVALRNVASGKVIEAAGNQTGNATLVQQWMDLVHPNQQWTIISI